MMTNGEDDCPGASHRTGPLIDIEQINGLLSAAGVDATREILAAFWRSTETLVAALQDQLGQGDLHEASRTAHALKGSALNVGALRLSCAARAIEACCREDDPGGALRNLSGVAGHVAETAAAFDAHFSAAA